MDLWIKLEGKLQFTHICKDGEKSLLKPNLNREFKITTILSGFLGYAGMMGEGWVENITREVAWGPLSLLWL